MICSVPLPLCLENELHENVLSSIFTNQQVDTFVRLMHIHKYLEIEFQVSLYCLQFMSRHSSGNIFPSHNGNILQFQHDYEFSFILLLPEGFQYMQEERNFNQSATKLEIQALTIAPSFTSQQ